MYKGISAGKCKSKRVKKVLKVKLLTYKLEEY